MVEEFLASVVKQCYSRRPPVVKLPRTMEVHTYLRHRAETQDVIYEIRKRQKEAVALRYNKGVKQIVHAIRSHVMLYQKKTGTEFEGDGQSTPNNS